VATLLQRTDGAAVPSVSERLAHIEHELDVQRKMVLRLTEAHCNLLHAVAVLARNTGDETVH